MRALHFRDFCRSMTAARGERGEPGGFLAP